MADNDITEFDEIDPLELHLVGTPATKFSALVAKSTEKGTGKMSKKKELKRLEKAIRQQSYPSVSSPHTTGVNLAGAGSTIGSPGTAARVVEAVFGQLDAGVRKAQGDLAEAEHGGTELAKVRARSNLATAMRRRFTAKMELVENMRGDRPASPFGAPLFRNGSSYQLPDDDPDISYVNDNRRP